MANGSRQLMFRLVLAAGAAALSGCAGGQSHTLVLLSTEDFIAEKGIAEGSRQVEVLPEVGTPPDAPAPQDELHGAPPMTAEAASEGIQDVGAIVGDWEAGPAAPTGRPTLIDAKIGEINGRPVRVEEVFRDRQLEERLIAEARQPGMTRGRWLAEVERAVRLQLDLMLREELLRAEALASLKPDQRMGLRYLVQELTDQTRREAGGSRAAAERRLREQHGQSLHQLAREREAQLLIWHQLDEKIRKRVRVSWKDVRLYYERNFEAFNPPATARMRIIRVPASDAEAVGRVQAALDEGAPFADVARMSENVYAPERGGLYPDVQFTGEFSEAQLGLHETFADAVKQLSPGEWTKEPVEFVGTRGARDKAWVYLESITRRHRPLSDRDVQREIADLLTRSAEEAEMTRYIESLKERASFTDLDDMTRRLVQIAAERYWPRD